MCSVADRQTGQCLENVDLLKIFISVHGFFNMRKISLKGNLSYFDAIGTVCFGLSAEWYKKKDKVSVVTKKSRVAMRQVISQPIGFD